MRPMHPMRPTRRSIVTLIAVALTALAAAAAPAQSHPNLAGRWVLDAARSEPGPLTPSAMSYTIQQSGDRLTVVRDVTNDAGHATSTLTYGVDGQPWKNSFAQGGQEVQATSTLAWEGATLVIRTTLTV